MASEGEGDGGANKHMGKATVDFQYIITPPGRLSIRMEVDATGLLPAELPSYLFPSLARVGLHLQLHPRYHRARWLGRGPHECYSDRQEGALLDEYTADIDDLHVPYITPMESGGRSDVRAVQLGSS